MTTIHIMLDLETWGTEPGCDIRSIGAVVFDPNDARSVGMVGTPEPTMFYIACDNPEIPDIKRENLSDQRNWYDQWDSTSQCWRKYPLTRKPQTVQWWNDQSDEARGAFADPVDLREALRRFHQWLHEITGEQTLPYMNLRLWSHGPAFDPPILAAAYRAVGLPTPWHYRAPRDTRTALEMAGMDPHKGLEPFSTGTHHNALDDAICQARAVCEAYRRLKRSAAWYDAREILERYSLTFANGMGAPRRHILKDFIDFAENPLQWETAMDARERH